MLNRNPSEDDGAAQAQAREERGLRLLHRARPLRGLTPEQVRRIASRLDAVSVPVRRRSLLPVLAALVLVLSAGTAVAWATGTLQRLPAVRALFASRPIIRHAPSQARGGLTPRPPEIASPTEQAPAGEPAMREVTQPPRREDGPAPMASAHRRASLAPAALAAHQERVAPPESAKPLATTPLTPDSPIAQEGESFANVLRGWRRGRDGRAALAALDLHDRRFARGQMALESRLLRVEILLSGGRDREALALLDGLALGQENVPRGRELLTVRGELRIKAGRCVDGRADLASIGGGTDVLAERARNALTYCR